MNNVFDIKIKNQLEYILSSEGNAPFSAFYYSKAVVLMYFYYEDTVINYSDYIDRIQKYINIVIITPQEEVAQIVKNESIAKNWQNVDIIMKPNQGRDVSGLLIAAKEYTYQYKYVCFIHDKKAHYKETEEDVAFWIENMWENLLSNMDYISKVINLFENDDKLGILVPPAPVGRVFKVWYGYGWRGCFERTKKLVNDLKLECDLDENKPPITIGTTLWFRSDALKKLFKFPWKYEDFDDEKLAYNEYLSYAIERVFAYVAQDAGYYTGEIMTVKYAEKQTLFLQNSLAEIFKKMHKYFPFPTNENVSNLDSNLEHMLNYIADKEQIYIFGTDDIGKFCAGYLRKKGYEPEAFIVDHDIKEEKVDNIPIIKIENMIDKLSGKGIIIASSSKRIQNEMIDKLKSMKYEDYCVFVQEAR